MMENFLGRDQFRKAVAVQYHINKFAQKTATSEDSLNSLSEFSKVDTTPIVNSYLNKPGIPLLTMATGCE
jgi:aminopeptidase N